MTKTIDWIPRSMWMGVYKELKEELKAEILAEEEIERKKKELEEKDQVSESMKSFIEGKQKQRELYEEHLKLQNEKY